MAPRTGEALLPAAEQASDLERWVRQARADHARRSGRASGPRVVVVAGGKGGVGKSNFSLNFSLALQERGRRVLLVDCDTGLGNLDVLLGLCPSRHLGHVLQGACALQEAMVPGPLGLRLLPAASGLQASGRGTGAEVQRLVAVLGEIAASCDLCVLDAGAGLGPQVRALLRRAGEILLVTTPEPPALADAYATLKVIRSDNARAQTRLVINMAEAARDAEVARQSVTAVARQFLGWSPGYLGFVPRDPLVGRAVREQAPFLLRAAHGPAARAVRELAAGFCQEAPARGRGLGDLLAGLLGLRAPGAGPPPLAAGARGEGGDP
jgi:flagellar biosynthesis protein FlhG